MRQTYIDHNTLDDIQFLELIKKSTILTRYLEEGSHHFEFFDDLFKDIMLMHYKHSVSVHSQLLTSVNYEIVQAMLQLKKISSLRRRTVGSTTNTYLALKLVLDGLFESLRGRSTIETIKTNVNLLNELIPTKSHIDELKDLSLTIDVKELLTTFEQKLLETYLDQFNRDDKPVSPNEFMDALVDESFDATTNHDNSLLHDQIKASIEKSIYEENDTSVETVLNNLIDQDSSNDTQHSDEHTEIQMLDESIGDEFKEHLKDELEEKFSPFLKEQYLTQGQNNESISRSVSELDESENEHQNHIGNNKVTADDEVIQQTAHKLSSTHENQLRQENKYSHSSNKAIDSVSDTPYSDAEFRYLENNLKNQIKNLNLSGIISQALDQVDTFVDTTKTLGVKENSLSQLSFDEVIQMHTRFKKPAFVKFINKVGKNKLYASKIQYKKKKAHSIPIDKVISSHNIDLLIEEEYISLALDIEAFENDFYDRYLRDDLLTIDMIRKQDKRKGPIVLCYDGSGSMEGAKIEETQSHILAIMEIAKIQKRHLVLIQFASASEPLYIKEINPTKVTAQDILDILDEFICGGTDFEKPLSKAIEYIKKDHHKKSDILFITDGQCEIRENFKEDFLKIKHERDFKLYTIIMHAYTYHDYGDIGDISDEVLEIRGQDIGHWNESTNKKLYSLI